MLHLYKRLLTLRRAQPELSVGGVTLVDAPEGVLAYDRHHGGKSLRILLNLTPEDIAIDWRRRPLLSTLVGAGQPGMLRANEGLVIA